MIWVQKINVAEIVSGHWKTLEDDRSGSRVGDVLLFYALPVVLTVTLAYFEVSLKLAAVNVLVNALAIMAGLLFNLLVVLQGFSAANRPKNQRVRDFARQIYDNIAYAIIVSLLTIVPLAVAANGDDQINLLAPSHLFFKIAGWIAMVLAFHFGLTMIMVLKRMYKMLQSEFA